MDTANSASRSTPSYTKLAQHRKAANQEQQNFADLIGVSRSTLQRYESGNVDNPNLRILVNAAIALNVPLGALIEDEWRKWRGPGPLPPQVQRREAGTE